MEGESQGSCDGGFHEGPDRFARRRVSPATHAGSFVT